MGERTLQPFPRGNDVRHEEKQTNDKTYACRDIIAVALHDTCPCSSRTQRFPFLGDTLHPCKTYASARTRSVIWSRRTFGSQVPVYLASSDTEIVYSCQDETSDCRDDRRMCRLYLEAQRI
jgi:hypothetical protein